MSVDNLERVAKHVLRCIRADPRRWDSNLIIIGHLAIGRQLPSIAQRLDPLLRRFQENDQYAVEFLVEDRGGNANNNPQDVHSNLKRQLARLRPTEFHLENDQLRYQQTEIKFHFFRRPRPNSRDTHYLDRPLLTQIFGEMQRANQIRMHQALPYTSVETALIIMIARCTQRCLLPGETSQTIAREVEALLGVIAAHHRNAQQGARGRGGDRLRWTAYHKRVLFSCLGKFQDLLSWRGPEGGKELKAKLDMH